MKLGEREAGVRSLTGALVLFLECKRHLENVDSLKV
jgi:hypothetical protein